MPGDIRDGMTADEVWAVVNDILDSVALAADDTDATAQSVYDVVSDYVTNHYGD